jgi:hypothetical protein
MAFALIVDPRKDIDRMLRITAQLVELLVMNAIYESDFLCFSFATSGGAQRRFTDFPVHSLELTGLNDVLQQIFQNLENAGG